MTKITKMIVGLLRGNARLAIWDSKDSGHN